MKNQAIFQISAATIQKWQEIVDLLAEILCVPSALIMKVEPPNIKVFVSSKSAGNPYETGELACLNTGLYCETVMKTRKLLLVPDALQDENWNANPDIKLGMIAYMGLPVTWPNGDIFGTICVLDNLRNEYSELYRKLLFQCREMLQGDLKSLQANNELELKILERTAELRRSEAYLTQAQKLSRTGSFGWIPSTGEIHWSDESFRIFQVDPSLKPTVELAMLRVHPDDRASVGQAIDEASHGDTDLIHRLLMPDGSVKHVHVRSRAVSDASGTLEVVGAITDITASKKAEDKLRENERRLHAAQSELSHMGRVVTLGELTASIAHEMRQPLGAIANNAAAAQMLLMRDIEEARVAIEQIEHDAVRADAVITRMRELYKKTDPKKTRLYISDVISDAVLLVRLEAARSQVSLELELASGLPTILGDNVQLQQVIINLVMNGIQAMANIPDGSRNLLIRSKCDGTDQVIVTVRDVGSGIDPEIEDKLFSPFLTTKPNGMGMGLSICRSIIEAHGGRVWASRNSGPGTTFHFALDGESAFSDHRQRDN